MKTWVFDQEKTRKALARMIIVDEQPFSMVDREGFKYFREVACSNFVIPSRSTITRDNYAIYLDEKEKLKIFIKFSCQRISLTTDTWISEQRINYMFLIGHFIDNDWRSHKKVLIFCPISSHKGEAIGKAIENYLLELDIDKVFTVTVDNARSNDNAISYLEKRFSSWGTAILGGKYIHVRCVAHIINLVVNDGSKEMDNSISHVRGVVRYIRQSLARLKKFKECANKEKCQSKRLLCLDVPTRWNSTYLKLDTTQNFEKVFERYEEQDPRFRIDLKNHYDGVPTENDWVIVRRFVLFLEHFYQLTLHVSGSLHVTSNIVFNEISNAYGILK
ncbi:hypothetical protein ACH5RR_030067 [Cinchona calisaya]|uniref:Transposase n=1 Tax=Cinchona calisaya TaxID=153742 RepID=A0ABD2YTH5_9GENT